MILSIDNQKRVSNLSQLDAYKKQANMIILSVIIVTILIGPFNTISASSSNILPYHHFSRADNNDKANDSSNTTTNISLIDPKNITAPKITKYTITPRSGTVDDVFYIIVVYQHDENIGAEYVRLIVDDLAYEMTPLNNDGNYSDGKDYFLKIKLSKGVHVFYFQISNGYQTVNSLASTILVTDPEEPNEFTHLDVVFGIFAATIIFLIPLIYGINQIRKLEQNLNRLANSNHKNHNNNNNGNRNNNNIDNKINNDINNNDINNNNINNNNINNNNINNNNINNNINNNNANNTIKNNINSNTNTIQNVDKNQNEQKTRVISQ
jgi:hypothetical protein